MDTGATRSCMNYSTSYKMGKNCIRQFETMQVVGADGSKLGAMGTIECKITIGDMEVEQTFIVCHHLRRNVILGTDFAKNNQAGVSWTRQGTRILSLKGVARLEVEEDELGTPVTMKHHVKIPPRYSAVFEVNLHGVCEGTKIISPNKQLMEANPNAFQHEISIKPENNNYFPVVAIINLDHAKTLHLIKGEVVGFAHDKEVEMSFIEMTNVLEMTEIEEGAPRNWVPERTWRKYNNCSEILPSHIKITEVTGNRTKTGEISPDLTKISRGNDKQGTSGEISCKNQCKTDYPDDSNSDMDFETDFLISPGDVYPNRKVKLEDAEISEGTRKKFEEMCERHPEAFSKNNKDIGRTTLIKMEIDTGDSLPVAQNPYTLPLKHHEWVRKEIETLEKAGVIERSLSPWASPVIVVPKKSAPDEPLRRCLCVDYRKVNALQQEVKWMDRGTGCLSLYPLPKIDEMLAKLKGARCFSTIDLRSSYYHIGLTRKSRAKSAFVVPMGKWEFKQTPFGLSQAPAYFQLLIDKVVMGCAKFAMGYLDDIIIFSKNEIEHLQHIEEIFNRLERFGL